MGSGSPNEEELPIAWYWGPLGVLLFILGFPIWIVGVVLWFVFLIFDGIFGTGCSDCLDACVYGQYLVLRWGCPPPRRDEFSPSGDHTSYAIQVQTATLNKYIKKHNLDPTKCVEAEPINSDADCFNFVQTHIGKKDLQAMVINSSKVFSNSRAASEEADIPGIRTLSTLIGENQDLVVLHLNGHRLDRGTLTVLMRNIIGHKSLKMIDLYDNKINDDGAAYIFNNVKDNPVQRLEVNLGANDVHTTRQLAIKEVIDTPKYKGKISVYY